MLKAFLFLFRKVFLEKTIRDRVGQVEHTSNYRHWSGGCVVGVKLEPRYNFDGEKYCKDFPTNPFWTNVGYAPKPMSRWDYFRWDILHGLLMKYDPLSVLVHAINNIDRRDDMIEENRKRLLNA